MTSHIKVAGVGWKDLDQPSIKVSGLGWKDCDSIHIRVAGVWKEVWAPAGPSAILTLNLLAALDSDFSAPYDSDCAVRVNTAGTVDEKRNGFWGSQNPGVEWIDDGGITSSDYEAKIEKTSGSETAALLGWTALNTYHDIDTTLRVAIDSTSAGDYDWNGTLTIREKADTGNSVSATVTLFLSNGL